jgi:DNA (cytosine-5)-methyltransferase 1
LGVAIGDLPRLRAGEGEHSTEYDLRRRAAHLRRYGAEACDYLMRVLEVERAPQLMNHVARPHSKRDLGDFRKLREGESSAVAMARGVKFDFPYDKSSFKDRYTRQSNSKPCSTIVAHLSKDGLMFIHPTQARSLTPREAARVQSFPDWFVFPRARTHAFRLIGNAVPPLVGEAIGAAIGAFLGASAGVVTVRTATRERGPRLPRGGAAPDTPKHIAEALAGPLRRAVPLDRGALRRLSQAELLAAWHSALALLPHLHPENARDHGTTTLVGPSNPDLPDDLARVLGRCHARSGWPVALTALGREAWRRVGTAQIPEASLYHPPASITHPSIQSRRNVRT